MKDYKRTVSTLESYRETGSSLKYYDLSYGADIELLGRYFSYDGFMYETSVSVGFKIHANDALSDKAADIYLRLTDSDGWEIGKIFAGRVVENYKGTLKGNFRVSGKQFLTISGAEIVVYNANV